MDSTQTTFFSGIKHYVQYDTWEQFSVNEHMLRRNWNDFTPFSWAFHPSQKNVLQIAWISLTEFRGDIPKLTPIQRLQSYLEIRTVEISFKDSEKSIIQLWLDTNTPIFWKSKILD